MQRYNDINPLVEKIAGGMARAHLNRAYKHYDEALHSELGVGMAAHQRDRALSTFFAKVSAHAEYVAALYGLPFDTVMDLTRASVLRHEDVEPMQVVRQRVRA